MVELDLDWLVISKVLIEMHLRVAERRGDHVLGRPFDVSEEVDISLLHFVLLALEKG